MQQNRRQQQLRRMGWGTCALIGAILGGAAVPARADTPIQTAYYPDATIPNVPGPSSAKLQIVVRASVGGSCGFASGSAPSGTVNAGAIDTTAWNSQVSFVPECTAPWRIAVMSQNGGLLTATPAPTSGFRNLAPYTVALHVVHDTAVIDANCEAKDLASPNGGCAFQGVASAENGLQVPRAYNTSGSYLQASAPAFQGQDVLVAGIYQDVLTVTVSPAT